jgi:hypothetical protein
MPDNIPCEICGTLIAFDQYIEHLENCYVVSRMRNVNLSNDTTSITTTPIHTNTQIIRIGQISDVEQALQHNIENMLRTAALTNNNQIDFDNIVQLLPNFFNTSNNFNFNLQLRQVTTPNEEPEIDYSTMYTELSSEEIEEDTLCSVCYESADRVMVKTKCNHIYCEKCLKEWLRKKTTCPICMNDLSTEGE